MASKIKPLTDDDERNQIVYVYYSGSRHAKDFLKFACLRLYKIFQAAEKVKYFKHECCLLKNVVEVIDGMFGSICRIVHEIGRSAIYERPIQQIVTEVNHLLSKTHFLFKVCKSKSSIVLHHLIPNTLVSAAKLINLETQLRKSVVDMTWLLNLFGGGGGGITVTPNSIAGKDPIISCVWTFIASLYMGQMSDKVEAADGLASLAKDNDRNKEYIVEEGGVAPLLKSLIKDNSSVEVQIAAATVLFHIANNGERIDVIRKELGVSIIVQAIGDSTMEVQIKLANLVARMSEHSKLAQADFGRANVIEQFVTLLLSIDSFTDELHGPVLVSSLSMQSSNETLLSLKTSCAEALQMLVRDSVSNSRRVLETKGGLLSLVRILEKEQGDQLMFNSLMTIMEVTVAAESDDLSRAAYTNSVAVKAIFDQLLRIGIKEHHHDGLQLKIPAIRVMGYLSRTYPAREKRVIAALVEKLSHINEDMATEAAIALCKFASPKNFRHVEHSKSILEFNGVLPLLRLLKKGNESAQFHGFVLICYLTLHAGNNETMEPLVLTTLVEVDHSSLFEQYPELIDLRTATLEKLSIHNSSGVLHPRQGRRLHLQKFALCNEG